MSRIHSDTLNTLRTAAAAARTAARSAARSHNPAAAAKAAEARTAEARYQEAKESLSTDVRRAALAGFRQPDSAMSTDTTGRTVAHPVRFFPATDGKGKWHAAWKVSGTAVCGAAPELATTGGEWIAPQVGDLQAKVHPLICKRCLRLTTSDGYTNAASTI